MKKALITFMVILVGIFTSCQKEETLAPFDETSIRGEVMAMPAPTVEEFVTFVNGPALKSATIEEGPLTMVMAFPLDARTIIISGNMATKFFLLYTFVGNTRIGEITVSQVFTIKSDGKIDPTSGGLQEAMPGCPFKEDFFIQSNEYFQAVRMSCNFSDGRQISFNGQLNGNSVKLPPLEGAIWQLLLSYNDGDLYQEFLTNTINFYEIPREVKLKINVDKDNIMSYIQIPKKYLVDASYIQIFTENVETGEITSYAEFVPVYDESLPEYVIFGVPFENSNRVNVYGNHGRISFVVNPVLTGPINGKPVFRADLPNVQG